MNTTPCPVCGSERALKPFVDENRMRLVCVPCVASYTAKAVAA